MKLGIPREVFPGEQRVAATPATVLTLIEMGFEVGVERGAGEQARYPDDAYAAAGAKLVDGPEALWGLADVVLKVCPPAEHPGIGRHEVELLRKGTFLVSFIWPAQDDELLRRLATTGATVFAMDQVPRVTRAQKMDALSSMSNIAGYRAVIEAAHHFGRFFSGQITAAGRILPAKVLIIGAGVAGLAAIAAARGLGAVVRAFDTRAEAGEQIESLGAEFLTLDVEESGEGQGGYAKQMSPAFLEAERKLFRAQAEEVDVVITTALIPGKPAPRLWDADMVAAMKPGSVVVDLASVQGGNCELTRRGEVVVEHGVTIVGHEDFTSRLATTASQLYGTNIVHLLEDMGGGRDFHVDMDDEVIRPAIVVHEGQITWPPPATKAQAAAKAGTVAAGAGSAGAGPTPGAAGAGVASAPAAASPGAGSGAGRKAAARSAGHAPPTSASGGNAWRLAVGLVLAAGWAYLRFGLDASTDGAHLAPLIQHMTVFVLACFVGWQVIWNVTPALHTPLMSVTNAISGIIIVGGLLASSSPALDAATVLGALAVLLAMINVAGGFLVTQRMLRMFRKD